MPDSPLQKFEDKYVTPRAGRTLIVGSHVYGGKEDRRLRYKKAVGVDMLNGLGVDMVLNLEDPLPTGMGQFAHVECMSVLEHSRRPWLMAQNIELLMDQGATLFLTVPFVWRVHGYPSDYFRFTADGVRELFRRIEWTQLVYASDRLRDSAYLLAQGKDEGTHPMMPRCEVLGFGMRR